MTFSFLPSASPSRRARPFNDLGFPHFLSPKHVTGGSPSLSSDVHTLGVLAFLVLTGRTPFPVSPERPIEGLSEEDVSIVHSELQDRDAPPVKSIRTDLPATFERIIDRCLQRRSSDRYQDASEFLEELQSSISD